jgi:hypothetical protein
MFHDRVAFGGALIAVGVMYMWLAEFPLRNGESWSWWALLFSGVVGFGNNLSYLGYGYLDSYHAGAVVLLFPFFVIGLVRSYRNLSGSRSIRTLFKGYIRPSRTQQGIGIGLLLFTTGGLFLAGITIMVVGMTSVFVPEDHTFIQMPHCARPEDISENLVPLIAHDRASFGGTVAVMGLMMSLSLLRTQHRRSLWEVLAIALSTGFGVGVAVHWIIGYTTFSHLLPAYLGVVAYTVGLFLTRSWLRQEAPERR